MTEQINKPPNVPPNNDTRPPHQRAYENLNKALTNYPVGSPEHEKTLKAKEQLEQKHPDLKVDSVNAMTEPSIDKTSTSPETPSEVVNNSSNSQPQDNVDQKPEYQDQVSKSDDTGNTQNSAKPVESQRIDLGNQDHAVQQASDGAKGGDGKKGSGTKSATASDGTDKNDENSSEVSAPSSQQQQVNEGTSAPKNKKLEELKKMLNGNYGQETDQSKGNTETPKVTEPNTKTDSSPLDKYKGENKANVETPNSTEPPDTGDHPIT